MQDIRVRQSEITRNLSRGPAIAEPVFARIQADEIAAALAGRKVLPDAGPNIDG